VKDDSKDRSFGRIAVLVLLGIPLCAVYAIDVTRPSMWLRTLVLVVVPVYFIALLGWASRRSGA
jgi:hypothetical protein